MSREEAIEELKAILSEATAEEYSVCYVTNVDEIPLKMAIEALENQMKKGKADAIEELLKQVQKEEMWLFKVIGSNQNINIAFGGIYAKAEQLKEQK